VTSGDQYVSTIVTKESRLPAAPVDNLGVVTLRDTFVPKGAGSKVAEFSAAEANQHVHTLFPALLEALPRVFASNGIRSAPIASEQVRGDDIVAAMARFDYVLEITPYQSSGHRGVEATALTLNAQIIDRHHATVWRGQVVLSTDHVRSPESPMYLWGAAMADEAARTLLAQLSKDAVVRTGPAVAQSVDATAFRGTERRALQGPEPAAPEPEVPAALAAVQVHTPAGDAHLFGSVADVRAALPAAPPPQIAVGRLQTMWDQKDGIIIYFGDGVATRILYAGNSKAEIPALGLALGASIKDFEAKLGPGTSVSARERSWPLDARRELAASYADSGVVQGLEIRVRRKPAPR
jgi:hypothetical protein